MIDKEHKYCIGKDDHSWEVGYDKGYQQGRTDMQEFVETRCKELGIDYILIFTCNSAD